MKTTSTTGPMIWATFPITLDITYVFIKQLFRFTKLTLSKFNELGVFSERKDNFLK
ncbi:hypothetical protein GCM10008015_04220 [Flavobacterium palustre]|uniref:Uncharacterized protein n=1 Tax=Flavobacterium palustre TaxID=1476463 RepID=A0ABQ1H9T0_9FLAO|nr:hypothetical protein GCM10008015_04220 [Flavobacterium palustre]